MSGATIAAGVLKALAMDLSSLEQLPSAVTAGAADVEEANFSFNAIAAESLHALAPFKNLKTLVLDNNELSSLRELPSLPQLRTLWVNNNGIDDLEETLNVLSRHCPQLEYLSLLRNPCCPNELIGKQETEYRRYRLYAKYRLPTLKILDTGKFTEQEATDAREKGKFLRAIAQKATPESGAGTSSVDPVDSTAAATEAEAQNNDNAGGGGGPMSGDQSGEEDLFAKYDKKKEAAAASGHGHGGPFFTQQRHFYSGKTSEGNRFIKDDVL